MRVLYWTLQFPVTPLPLAPTQLTPQNISSYFSLNKMASALRSTSSHDEYIETIAKEAVEAAQSLLAEGFKTWATLEIAFAGVEKDLHRLVFTILDSEGAQVSTEWPLTLSSCTDSIVKCTYLRSRLCPSKLRRQK